MKLLNSVISLIFITHSISITSCGQASSKEDALTYYTTIALQMKEVVPNVNAFWSQMKQGVLSAKNNQEHKLDKPSLDSLKTSLSHIIADLDSKIKIVTTTAETTNNLNFRKTVLSYLTETKALQETAIPKILDLLETGLDKINNQQKEAFQQFTTKGQELQIKSKQIEDLSLEFQKRHNITNDELSKYGL